MKLVTKFDKGPTVRMGSMLDGQAGVFSGNRMVYKCNGQFVIFNDQSVWISTVYIDYEVTLLPEGTEITLKV